MLCCAVSHDVARMFSKSSSGNQVRETSAKGEKRAKRVYLICLVYLVEEKHGDLESAFFGLACWGSPLSRG